MQKQNAPQKFTARNAGRITIVRRPATGIDEEANQEADHGRNKETEANLQEDRITEEDQREGPHPKTYTN